MKSSLKNMVLVLTSITLLSSAAVGGVYMITKKPVEEAAKQKFTNALAAVLPEFDAVEDVVVVKPSDGSADLKLYKATKAGEKSGYAVETSALGFTQDIVLLVGFDKENNIYKIAVLSHAETPGLGAKITNSEEPFVVQFEGKNPETTKLSVKKDGGDLDAITASTITSRAYASAVKKAYEAVKELEK